MHSYICIYVCTFTLFIVKYMHCPAIPVAREKEEEEERNVKTLIIPYESVSE